MSGPLSGTVVSLPKEVRKVCKTFLTESRLEGARMQATDRLPPATESCWQTGQGWVTSADAGSFHVKSMRNFPTCLIFVKIHYVSDTYE